MDKKRKSQIRKYILLAMAAATVLVLAVLPMIAAGKDEAEGPQVSILSAKVEKRDIDSQIIGGGQLASQTAVNVKIAENIKLTEYLVGNGDLVSKGDAIAKVDKVSVMTAITEVQETLDYLAEEISSVSTEKVYENIDSLVKGTVKTIYAEKGEDVRDVMLDHGALAALSLDGIMAVKLELESDLVPGAKVAVIFKDGTETEGRIKSNLAGVLTVTMEDDKYSVGEEVEIKSAEGKSLGSGELYIYSQWNVTAYAGTVSDIYVDVNDSIYVGRTLIRLSDPGHDAEYQRLIDQRHDYEELMQELFVMHSSGEVTAPCDGIVTGVDVDASYMLETGKKAGSEQDKSIMSLIASGGSSTGSESGGGESGGGETGGSETVGDETDGGETSGDETDGGDTGGGETGGDETGGGETGDDETGGGETGDDETGDNAGDTGDNQDGKPAPKTYRMYPATILELADGLMKVSQTPYCHTVTDLENLPQVSADVNNMTEEQSYSSPLITAAGFAVGDTVLLVLDENSQLVKIVKAAAGGAAGGTPSQAGGQAGMTAGGFGGMSGMGSSVQVPVFELYSLEKTTIASVTSQEQMSIEFTVDELDISKVYTGQPLTIAVEAIAGETFDASITEIANSGENNGGNSKFTVCASVEKNTSMLPGMTAYAFIKLDTAVNALSIPAAALYAENGNCFVYTSYDEKTESPTNPVPVNIGIADADYVQIIEGLTEGQAVYYEYFENKNN